MNHQLYNTQVPLSPFQQTLREKEEEFYKTFPAARLALQAELHHPTWYPVYDDSGCVAGSGFHISDVQSPSLQLHAPFLHSHTHPAYSAVSHSTSSYSLQPANLAHQPVESHGAHVHDNYPVRFTAPLESPLSARPATVPNVVPPPLHVSISAYDILYQGQYQQQQGTPPVMDSLASPDHLLDPAHALRNQSPYRSSPQQAYQSPSPVDTVYNPNTFSSPVHQEAPVIPPSTGLAQPALNHYDVNPVDAAPPVKSEKRYFTELSEQEPQRETPVRSSRRNSQQATLRSQRRYSPQYARPQQSSNKSRGSANTTAVSNKSWSPSPSSPTAAGASTSVSASPTTTNTSRRSTTTKQATSGSSTTGRRHSDKKPALACIFCRGRKIACGPPVKDGDGRTCNQCHRRSLRCEYPTESRRGMRKKATVNINPNAPKVVINRKR